MANNTIKLAVYGIPPVELEQISSGAAVTPGMLLIRAIGGTVVLHNVADGFASPPLVAVEDVLSGAGIDDLYAVDANVFFIGARPGDVMWMWLATGQTSAIGNQLVSAGSGHLAVAGVGPFTDGAVIGTALEVVDASGGAARVKVEIA